MTRGLSCLVANADNGEQKKDRKVSNQASVRRAQSIYLSATTPLRHVKLPANTKHLTSTAPMVGARGHGPHKLPRMPYFLAGMGKYANTIRQSLL